MNTKSVDSTDFRWGELERVCAELERDFPLLGAHRQSHEPEAGLFRPLELARLPVPARQLMAVLGLSLYRIFQEFAGELGSDKERRGLPPLGELLGALEAELQYSARALEAAIAVERRTGQSKEAAAILQLARRSARRLATVVHHLEAARQSRQEAV
jgi:hypothetical protein